MGVNVGLRCGDGREEADRQNTPLWGRTKSEAREEQKVESS